MNMLEQFKKRKRRASRKKIMVKMKRKSFNNKKGLRTAKVDFGD